MKEIIREHAEMIGQYPALDEACQLAWDEALRATARYHRFNSSHEGYAVLQEAVDELWDAIKSNNLEAARKEAVQVAAMALRYIAEVPPTKEIKA